MAHLLITIVILRGAQCMRDALDAVDNGACKVVGGVDLVLGPGSMGMAVTCFTIYQ